MATLTVDVFIDGLNYRKIFVSLLLDLPKDLQTFDGGFGKVLRR